MPDLSVKAEGLLARLLNSTDPTRDLKLAAYGGAVVAAICWLTREQARGPITPAWVEAFKWFLISVSLGGGAWAAVDKWRPKGAPQDPSPVPTEAPNVSA